MTRSALAFLVLAALSPVTAAAQEKAARMPTTPPPASATLLNLNTATLAQLESLPGIGRSTAERIIEYRQKSGGFKKIEELMNVRGIGEKNFLTLKPLITVSAPRTERASQP
jgi:competence protein ComEA